MHPSSSKSRYGSGMQCSQHGVGQRPCLSSPLSCLKQATTPRRDTRSSTDCICRLKPGTNGSARVACQATATGKLYIDPVLQHSSAFAPATIANLGPGFDWMGCAVEVHLTCTISSTFLAYIYLKMCTRRSTLDCLFSFTNDCCHAVSFPKCSWSAVTLAQYEIGVAMQGEGDIVTASILPDRPGAVLIESIQGDGGRLSLDASKNCVGIAALETLKLLGGQPSCGISLTLKKVVIACKSIGSVACQT